MPIITVLIFTPHIITARDLPRQEPQRFPLDSLNRDAMFVLAIGIATITTEMVIIAHLSRFEGRDDGGGGLEGKIDTVAIVIARDEAFGVWGGLFS